ncbi:hypothetical protein B0H13DRAFT_1616094, partial [Mycena leptocephala]
SSVRQINNVDPVKGANNPPVNCNGAQLASDIADANPGDTTSFLWTDGPLAKCATSLLHLLL